MCKNNGYNWDRITAIIAVLIASVSVIVSVVSLYLTSINNNNQLELTLTHNKLSVKPVLSFVRKMSKNNEKIGFNITNKGLGPARIKSMIFGINDEWFKKGGKKGSIRVLRELNIPKKIITRGSYSNNGRGMLNNGESKWLYYATTDNDYKNKKNVLNTIGKSFNVAVCYCSMYEECKSIIRKKPYPPAELFECN